MLKVFSLWYFCWWLCFFVFKSCFVVCLADLSLLQSGEWEADDPATREGGKIKIRYGLQVSNKAIVAAVIRLKFFVEKLQVGLTATTFYSASLQVSFDGLPGFLHMFGFHGCKALLHSVVGLSVSKVGSTSELSVAQCSGTILVSTSEVNRRTVRFYCQGKQTQIVQ